MKKFYYKKNVPVDKTPIIMRLERRHTVNADKDAMEAEQRRLSTRSSSVDRLKNAPCVSKLKDREITKCLSEDVLNKAYFKNSTKIITERELSASWLYKTRKASINSKDSPQKVSQPADLSPVMLNDPNLMPVPVKSKDRNKKNSSCLCYFAIMMAISFCTVGFLAAVAGFLYSEIFPENNSTLPQVQKSMDVTNLTEEFQSKDNSTYGFRILNNETLKISFDSANYSLNKRTGSVSNEIESEKIDSVHFGKLDVTDLSQFLDNRKAEIKFQDGDTIIFEMNSSKAIEHEKSINIPNNIERLEPESNLNKSRKNRTKETAERTGQMSINIPNNIERLEPKDNLNKARENRTEDISVRTDEINVSNNMEKLEVENNLNETRDSRINGINERTSEIIEEKFNEDIEVGLNSQPNNLNGSLSAENNENRISDILSNNSETGKNSIMSSSDLEVKFESQVTTTESNELETSEMEEFKSSSSSPRFHDVIPEKDQNQSASSLEDADVRKWKINEKLTDNKQESDVKHHENIFPLSENTDQSQNDSDHDVKSMLMEVNEPSEETQDEVFINRNGEIMPLTESSDFEPSPNINPVVLKRDQETVMRVSTEPQNLEHLESKQPLRTRPQDMKVTLAEAMKHLQALDVNNKLLTSRIKPVKFKPHNTKTTKLVQKPRNNQPISNEKMQYLQNLRLALQGSLQRM